MVHKPREPAAGECCGSGCARCVWDVYYDNLDKYEAHRMERKQQLKIKRQAGVERKVLDIEDLRSGGGQAEIDDDDDDLDDDDSEEGDGTADVGHVSASAVGSVVVKYEMSAMGGAGGPSKVDKVLDTLLLTGSGDSSNNDTPTPLSPSYVGQLRGYLYGEDAHDVSSLDADEMKRFGGMDAEGDDDEEERSNKSSMMVGGASSNNHGVYGVSSDSAVRRFPESFGAELASKYAGGPDTSLIHSHIIKLLQHRASVLGVGADAGVEAALSALTSDAPGFVAKRLRQEVLMKAKQRLRRLVMDTDGLSSHTTGQINVCLLPPKAVDYVIGGSVGKEAANTAVPIEAANPHLGALVRLYDAAHNENTTTSNNKCDVGALLENAHQHYVDGGWRFVDSVQLTAASSTPYVRGGSTMKAESSEDTATPKVDDDAPLCILRVGLKDITGGGGACRSTHPPDSNPVPGDVLDLYTENSDTDVMWLCKRLGLQPARKLSLSPSPFGPEGGFPRWLPSPFNHRYHYGVTLQEGDRLQLQNIDANLKRLEADFSDIAPSTSDEHVVRDAEERQRRAKEKQASIIQDALLSDDSDEEEGEGRVPPTDATTPTATSAVPPPSSLWLSGRCLAHMTAKHLFQRYVDLHSSAYLRPPLFTMLSGCIRDPVGFDEKPILSILSAAGSGVEGDALRAAILADVDMKAFKDEDLVKSFEFYLQRAALQLLTHTHRSQQHPTTTATSSSSLGYLTTINSTDVKSVPPPPQSFATQRDTHQTLTRLVNATNPSMKDILATFSHCKPNLPRLLEVAAPLRPRRFSVASVHSESQAAATPLGGQSVDLVVRQILKNAPSPSVSGDDGNVILPNTNPVVGVEGSAFQTALYAEMGVLATLQCVRDLHNEALQLTPATTPMHPQPFCGFITQRLVEMAMSQQQQYQSDMLAGKRARESPIWARHVPVRAQPRFSPTTPSTITTDVTEVKVRQLLDRSKCPVMPLFPIPLSTSHPHIATPLSTTCTVAPHHPVYVIAGGSGYAPLRGWLFQRLATQKQLLRTSPTAAIGTTTVLMGLRRCAEAVVFAQEMEPWSRLDDTSSSSLPLSVNAYLSRTSEDGSGTPRYPNVPSFLNLHAGMRMTLGEGGNAIFMDPSIGGELAAAIIDDPTIQPPPPTTVSSSSSVVRSLLPSSSPDDPSSGTTTSGGVIVACGPGPFLTSIREALISAVGSSSRLLPAEDRGDRSIAEHHVVRAEYDRRVVFDTWKAA